MAGQGGNQPRFFLWKGEVDEKEAAALIAADAFTGSIFAALFSKSVGQRKWKAPDCCNAWQGILAKLVWFASDAAIVKTYR